MAHSIRQTDQPSARLRRDRLQQRAYRTIPFFVVLVIWWLVTDILRLVPPYKLPPPSSVVTTAVFLWQEGVLVAAIFSSVLNMLLGFLVGTLLGGTLGVLVGINRHAAAFVMPLATFFQAVAGPTWIPLAVLWFGLGRASVAFIVFNTVFFLVFYTTLVGITTINQNLINSVRTLGGNTWDVIKDVLLPGALPSMINGLRVGIGYGWRALIAAEIIAVGVGLGVLIWEGQRYFRVADIFLGLVLIGLINLTMERLFIQRLEENTVRKWGLVSEERR